MTWTNKKKVSFRGDTWHHKKLVFFGCFRGATYNVPYYRPKFTKLFSFQEIPTPKMGRERKTPKTTKKTNPITLTKVPAEPPLPVQKSSRRRAKKNQNLTPRPSKPNDSNKENIDPSLAQEEEIHYLTNSDDDDGFEEGEILSDSSSDEGVDDEVEEINQSVENVHDEQPSAAVKRKKTEEDEAPWTATSRKRKEIYNRSIAHLQPLAKKPHLPPSTPRNSQAPVVPSAPRTIKKKPVVAASKKYPKIDWVTRKDERDQSDNIAFVDPMIIALLEVFHDVAREVRGGDLAKVGPTFLWTLLPAFIRAIEETPWGFWFDSRKEGENGEREYVVFINWHYGAVSESLTPGQMKFRQSCLGKVSLLFEDKVRGFLSNPDIKVLWSKYYGENMTY
jgi:hypothetical protein